MEKPVQVTLYDTNTIKQTLDDSIIKYLTTQLNYTQHQKLNYTKVLLGFFGCVLAAIAQFYPIPFPKNKPVLILCQAKINQKIKVSSVLPKYDPIYSVKIEDSKNPKISHPFTKSIDLYFDTKGTFLESAFHNDLVGQFKSFSKLSKKD
ncbi:hypothetical protein DICPUDRAFT_75426 [Dictyostelium purpureum]|uniref:Signal peptidase complex subunit 2 n=1 Tax=Dictyostelium purpureum TaxID=5786 RepID=F0ZAM6_DICPU|nr:uncharacterized protein DICPUDRAFT_75426 [Dictyostelium purpureum]EGC39002.1 hypothetical protein DICPUDRAFT_75426 [Dictyostelium purpureum]|eukprot:XP_003284455.1 hypothetical protein DICPUDRAFT_75426 [Dictyostelium purpureum]